MRLFWTLLKVAIALVLVIPICIIALATVAGIFGALLGLAFLTLRLAVVGLIGYGAFRVAVRLFGGRKRPEPVRIRELPPVDPYFEASMRELDRDLGEPVR